MSRQFEENLTRNQLQYVLYQHRIYDRVMYCSGRSRAMSVVKDGRASVFTLARAVRHLESLPQGPSCKLQARGRCSPRVCWEHAMAPSLRCQ
jgi:hypothetical protein